MSSADLNRNSVLILLAASLAFNAGVGVTFGIRTYRRCYCSEDCPKRGDGPCRFGLFHELDLTPEQEAEMDAARKNLKQRCRELREEVRSEADVLAELIAAAEPDHEAITTQVDKVARLRKHLDQRMVEYFLDIKQTLDPQQHEAFNEMIRRALARGGPGRRVLGGPREHPRHPGRGMKGRSHGFDD